MTNKIYDIELGEVELSEVDKTIAETEGVDGDSMQQTSTETQWDKYKQAFETGDVDTLESIRLAHPEDARFNLHLKVLDIPLDDRGLHDQAEIEKLHKQVNQAIGIDGAREFNDLLEAGNKAKLKEYVSKLDDKNPLKASMLRLVKYV